MKKLAIALLPVILLGVIIISCAKRNEPTSPKIPTPNMTLTAEAALWTATVTSTITETHTITTTFTKTQSATLTTTQTVSYTFTITQSKTPTITSTITHTFTITPTNTKVPFNAANIITGAGSYHSFALKIGGDLYATGK
ncbi:MAG TPA: hypothetical protein P5511_08450, partial [Candidatus Goldiibacteriota bacterium]|nr:hypothetical protein [Candidatus Goldiibacteriota bacterium]